MFVDLILVDGVLMHVKLDYFIVFVLSTTARLDSP